MLTDGTAKAIKRTETEELEVMQYQAGSYFGERALLMNDLRAASIIATSDVIYLLSFNNRTGSNKSVLGRFITSNALNKYM